MTNVRSRFLLAMAGYGALALLAAASLDGRLRLAVWIFLGALAVKTWVALRARP